MSKNCVSTTCASNEYFNYDANTLKCMSCNSSCATCSADGKKCVTCPDGYSLGSTICLKCAAKQTISGDTCVDCGQSCDVCSSADTCTTCEQNADLDAATGKCNCKNTYFYDTATKACTSCSANCQDCSSSTQCTKC